MTMALGPALAGHFWTIEPVAASLLRPVRLPHGERWVARVDDRDVGPLCLSGELREPIGGSDTVVLALHGLGGDIDSHYIRRSAAAALAAGFACVRFHLRGADGSGAIASK